MSTRAFSPGLKTETATVAGQAEPLDALLNLRQRLARETGHIGLDMFIKAFYDLYKALEIFKYLTDNPGCCPAITR